MGSVLSLLFSLAVVAVAAGGMATIAGQLPLRDRCFRAAVWLVIVALIAPLLANVITGTLGALPSVPNIALFATPAWLAFLLGHLTLAVVLIRRRAGGATRAERQRLELEQARGRARPRLPPDTEENEP